MPSLKDDELRDQVRVPIPIGKMGIRFEMKASITERGSDQIFTRPSVKRSTDIVS